MSSVASRWSTIASPRRSRSCEVGTSPARIAVAAWKRKRRTPSYSITTSRSGVAVSTALSRYACGEAARFVLMCLPWNQRWNLHLCDRSGTAKIERGGSVVVGQPGELTGEPAALRLALRERPLHGGELRAQACLTDREALVHARHARLKLLNLVSGAVDAGVERAAGGVGGVHDVLEPARPAADVGDAREQVAHAVRVRGERGRELLRVERELASERVFRRRRRGAAGRDAEVGERVHRGWHAGHRLVDRLAHLAEDVRQLRVAEEDAFLLVRRGLRARDGLLRQLRADRVDGGVVEVDERLQLLADRLGAGTRRADGDGERTARARDALERQRDAGDCVCDGVRGGRAGNAVDGELRVLALLGLDGLLGERS